MSSRTGMIITQSDDELVVLAPAKVNLHLEILAKRSDGFHELETIMLAISLYDRLVFRPAKQGTTLRCEESQAGDPQANLVTRAIELVRQETGITHGVEVSLDKQIPVAAGLAGGSSDAAATLVAINQLWNLGWSTDRLGHLAEQLGSDISFFLHGSAAICRGRGERVVTIDAPAGLPMVIVSPTEGLSTKLVFSQVRVPANPRSADQMTLALKSGKIDEIASCMFNRLEEASIAISPVVAELKRKSQTWPCVGSLMSGSGSSFVALCESNHQAGELASLLKAEQIGRVFAVTSV